MARSSIFKNSRKMNSTISILLFNFLLLITSVLSICVKIPNDEMIEYSCTGGSETDLSSVPESAEKIRITNMPIPRVTNQTFSRYGGNLWVLNCTHCWIRAIDPDAFQGLVNLQQLCLDNNHLVEVNGAWFVGMKNLSRLDLNYNQIERIDDGVWKNLPSLVDFRISGNRLECLNITAMSSLNDIQNISFTENPDFKCSPEVSEFLVERQISLQRDPKRRVPRNSDPFMLQRASENSADAEDKALEPSADEEDQGPEPPADEGKEGSESSAEDENQAPKVSAKEGGQAPKPSADEKNQASESSADEEDQGPEPPADEEKEGSESSAEDENQAPKVSAKEGGQAPKPSADEKNQASESSADEEDQGSEPSAEDENQAPEHSAEEDQAPERYVNGEYLGDDLSGSSEIIRASLPSVAIGISITLFAKVFHF